MSVGGNITLICTYTATIKQQYILTATMFVYWHRGHDKKLRWLV